ncbi:hypothetical protein J6O48_04080 [bacterium]|nr:hypothetical protein [bacterium]
MLIKLGLIAGIILTGAAGVYLYRRNSKLRKKFEKIQDYLGDMNTIADSVRYGNLSVRAESSPKEMSQLTKSINRMIETLNDREKMITEYQMELTKKNNFLSTLFDSLTEGIIVCDEKFKILDCNQNIKNWLKSSKILNKKLEEFITVSSGNSFDELENEEVIVKGAKDLFFRASTKPLEFKEHKGKYMVVISNYTDQKEIESLKEDFVATLTHDLKVPIIAEANMLEFLLNEKFGEITENQKEALNSMKSSNKELLDLVQIVLDTYKVKEGEVELNLEKVSVRSFLEEISSEMEAIAHKTNNKIIVDIKNDFEINVDYMQFKRVLKNLVNNSIIYGKPDTNIELKAKQKDNHSYIYVKDYGKGVAKEDIDKIFNRYYSASKKFRKIGTGLGLYYSYKVVSAHNGELTVDSKEGEWAEFCIKLAK